jgi:hypothetical protein
LDLIPPEALTDFIEFLASELCFDPASSAVSAVVLDGLSCLLGRFGAVRPIAPRLAGLLVLLRDPAETVYREFIRLLTRSTG